MNITNGIDVSQWQGIIDFDKVKASGDVSFVMIRAGFGQGGIDPQYHRNISECNRVGIPCGVYWFSYALDVDMAIMEAQYCIAACKGFKLALPIAFDFEYDSVEYAAKNGVTVTNQLASDMARAFCRTVRDAGYKPLMYTNPDYLSRYFDADIPAEFPVWLAQYPGYKPDPAQHPRNAMMWQWGKGKVDGITSSVDMDYGYFDETGSGDNPSAWAKEACDWCREHGIFNGDGLGNFDWQGPITREQTAQLIYNLAHMDKG